MNQLRFLRIYMILYQAACYHGGQSCFYSLGVWINTKYNMNLHEFSRINQMNMSQDDFFYDLSEFVWYYTERRVATRGSLAYTAWVCELLQNINYII